MSVHYRIQKFNVDFTASGDTVAIVAASSAIYVTRVALTIAASAIITIKNGVGGNTVGGPYVFPSAGTIVFDDIPPERLAWWEAAPTKALVINNDTNTTRVSGQLWAYIR